MQDIQTSYAKLPGSHMSAQLAENNDRKPSQSLAWGIHSANASEYQGMLFIQMLSALTYCQIQSGRIVSLYENRTRNNIEAPGHENIG